MLDSTRPTPGVRHAGGTKVTREADLIKTLKLHEILEQLVNHEPVPDADVTTAEDTIRLMYQQAAEYGFTKADVLRAVLRPIMENKRGCDCPTCKVRRGELIEQEPNWEAFG